MHVTHVEEGKHVPARHPGVSGGAVILKELQEPTPVRMPALRQAEHIGHAPGLPRKVIAMAGEKMPSAIARGLPISVGDVLKARQRPHLSERFRRIHRRQHGPEVQVLGRRQLVPFVEKAHSLGRGLMKLALKRLPSCGGQLRQGLRGQHLPLPALGQHEGIAGLRQQPMPGLRPSFGQSLLQAKPPFRREALRQRCPILSRCKHRPNPYKPLGAQPIQRKRAACAALSRFHDRFDAEASP